MKIDNFCNKLSVQEKIFYRGVVARIDNWYGCAIGNGGPASFNLFPHELKINPIVHRGLPYIAGTKTYKEFLALYDVDIKKAPPMDRPLLIFDSGKDKLIPNPIDPADYFIEWAVGETELKWYPEGEHVCANYLDEMITYTVDRLKKRLMNS